VWTAKNIVAFAFETSFHSYFIQRQPHGHLPTTNNEKRGLGDSEISLNQSLNHPIPAVFEGDFMGYAHYHE
jgi:hypothetical protein